MQDRQKVIIYTINKPHFHRKCSWLGLYILFILFKFSKHIFIFYNFKTRPFCPTLFFAVMVPGKSPVLLQLTYKVKQTCLTDVVSRAEVQHGWTVIAQKISALSKVRSRDVKKTMAIPRGVLHVFNLMGPLQIIELKQENK